MRKVYNAPGLAGYFLAQYVGNQNAINRYQMSRNWLPPGNIRKWAEVKKKYRKKGFNVVLARWHEWLDENHQTKLVK